MSGKYGFGISLQWEMMSGKHFGVMCLPLYDKQSCEKSNSQLLFSHLKQRMNSLRSWPMRKVVVNSTPMIAFCHVDGLDLLHK